jgi:hypothetical protein
MPAFADAIKLVDRLVEYSVAVVKQYYLITTGAILTLVLPWLEDRYFASAAQTDLKFFIDRWSLRVGIALLFIATFRAWNEQREEVGTRHAEPCFKGFMYPFNFVDVSYEKDFYGIEIRIQIDIRNLGSPSVVTSWRLYLDVPDGPSKQFGETLSRPGFRDLQHTISTAELVSEAPIIPGGGRHTFNLRFHASGTDRDLIIGRGKMWRLVYSDVMGNEYKNSYRT